MNFNLYLCFRTFCYLLSFSKAGSLLLENGHSTVAELEIEIANLKSNLSAIKRDVDQLKGTYIWWSEIGLFRMQFH